MSATSDIQTLAMKLPPKSRLKLAGELLRSLPDVVADHSNVLAEARTRDAQLENGSIIPLSEEEFWQGATPPAAFLISCQARPHGDAKEQP